jgi:hypothetical protein
LRANQLDSDHSDAYLNLGIVYPKEKNPREVLSFLEKGIALNLFSREEQVEMGRAE